jgi:hypothetical protein
MECLHATLARSEEAGDRRSPPQSRREAVSGYASKYIYEEAYVYGLVDPRTSEMFYVGKAVRPLCRFQSHRHDRCSSAYERIREIEAVGLSVEIRILGTFTTDDDALDFEYEAIRSTPGLLNRKPGRTPIPWWARPRHDLTYVPLDDFETPDWLPDPVDDETNSRQFDEP